MTQLSNKPSRNGFDLSRKNAFTAKVGELLPVMCQEVIPGDKFKINAEWFTRTRPVKTSAFTRMREYYDFYFVPARLLWRHSDNFFTQMPVADSARLDDFKTKVGQSSCLPWFDSGDLLHYFTVLRRGSGALYNEFGFNRINATHKLLDYLDYGNLLRVRGDDDIQGTKFASVYSFSELNDDDTLERNDYLHFGYNVMPLAAYQKIYADYYRFDQWEQSSPTYYNFDFISPSSSVSDCHIPIQQYSQQALKGSTLFDLRYCNWHKDLFHGLLPSAQYGDVSSVSTVGFADRASETSFILHNPGELRTGSHSDNHFVFDRKESKDGVVNADAFNFSILALRQAEFLQRWKEISNSGNQSYKEQMKKHWNVDISNSRSSRCDYVGGLVGNLSISEVVNTNLASDAKADIAGKAVGVGNGDIDFEAKEHGIFMCIYHCLPILDYESYGTSPLNFKLKPTDFAIPEMDKVGMQLVPPEWLVNDELVLKGHQGNDYLGYAPRYIDYKTSVDKVHGDFTYTTKDWVAPLSRLFLRYLFSGQDVIWSYAAMKCNPSVLNPIFGVNVGDSVDTDQLLCNVSFDFKAVRNLDVNGLPY